MTLTDELFRLKDASGFDGSVPMRWRIGFAKFRELEEASAYRPVFDGTLPKTLLGMPYIIDREDYGVLKVELI